MSLKPPTIIAGRRPLRVLTLVGVTAKRGPTYAAGQVSLTMSTTGAGRRARRVVGSGKMMMGASGLARIRRRTTGVGSMSLAASAASRRRRRSGPAATTMTVATSGAARRARRSGVGTAAAAFNANAGSIVKPSWVAPGPIAADIDFRNNRAYRGDVGAMPLDSLLTVQRSTAAYIDDLAGNWTLVPANTLRRSDKGALIEGAQTNLVPNTAMVGAVVGLLGSGGRLPDGWSAPGATEVVAVGKFGDFEFIRLRCQGAAGTGLRLSPMNSVAVTPGTNLFTMSTFVRLVSGSLAPFGGVLQHRIAELSPSVIAPTSGAFTPTADNLSIQRFQATRTLNAATTSIRTDIYTNGSTADYDLTIDIGVPQLEQWNPASVPQGGASSPIRTAGAAATRAADMVTGTLTQALSSLTVAGVVQQIVPTTSGGIIRLGSTLADRVDIRQNASNPTILQIQTVTGGVAQPSFNVLNAFTPNTRTAFAYAGTAGDQAASVAGGAVSGNAPTAITPGAGFSLGFSPTGGMQAFNGYIERLSIRSDRVANANLPALSTLAA